MPPPSVSFVVPCYKLAHLLAECIRSILAQTYKDFELLVMDDCSPDDTQAVAHSFRDPRVRYIRNSKNLGHLSNYNEGIALSRGTYVWLISADDYLRSPHVLERYVTLLDSHPSVGYAFCPGFGVRDGIETRVLGSYAARGDRDRIISSHRFLKKLLTGNFVLTPSGMVRRQCYEKLGRFPLNMPWAGDWYLWSLFAMHYDVAYFSEPMLCYREHHALSMTEHLTRKKVDACAAEEIGISWTLRQKALDAQHYHLDRACLSGIAHSYARTLSSLRYQHSSYYMNLDQFERSLVQHATTVSERHWIRSRVYACVGNEYYWQRNADLAKDFYRRALTQDPLLVAVHIKMLLLSFGERGDHFRSTLLSLR